jgi:hypothetical protein
MAESLEIVDDLQQIPAARAVIDRLPDGMIAGAAGGATKDRAVLRHLTERPLKNAAC